MIVIVVMIVTNDIVRVNSKIDSKHIVVNDIMMLIMNKRMLMV
jgi:hypothetical protein